MRLAVCFFMLATLLLAPTTRADEVDHPSYTSWADQPVGTVIKQRSETDTDGHVLTTTTTSTLKEMKPDKAIFTVQRVSDATGNKVESAPEPYELIRKFPLFPGVKRENIGKPTNAVATGQETLELAGRTIPAVWFDTKSKGDGGLDLITRTWMSDKVPGRLVKSVTRIPKAKTVITVELTDWTRPGQNP